MIVSILKKQTFMFTFLNKSKRTFLKGRKFYKSQ